MQHEDTPVVYFIQAEDGGPIKIGYSEKRSGVAARLGSLQTGNPRKLVVRHVQDAPRGHVDERDLHERFARYRLNGEWFLNVPEVAMVSRADLPEDEERLLEPILRRIFDHGREHGRLEVELETRRMLREFFTQTMGFIFRDEESIEDDLELSGVEQALERICNQVEMARFRRAAQARREPAPPRSWPYRRRG